MLAYPSPNFYRPYLETIVCVLTENVDLAHAQIGFLRGEITTQDEWEGRKLNTGHSPPGADATISGRISGFGKALSAQVEAWRIGNDQAVPFSVTGCFKRRHLYDSSQGRIVHTASASVARRRSLSDRLLPVW